MYMLQGKLLNNAYLFNSRHHKEKLDLPQNVVERSWNRMKEQCLQETRDQGIVIYLIKKGELRSLWEMKDVEDFNQTNEGNNEGGRKETTTCRHTTFRQ